MLRNNHSCQSVNSNYQ